MNTHDELVSLRGLLVTMLETVDGAMSGDQVCLDLIMEEYGDHGTAPSMLGSAVHRVCTAQQYEDEAAAEMAEAEEFLKHCMKDE